MEASPAPARGLRPSRCDYSQSNPRKITVGVLFGTRAVPRVCSFPFRGVRLNPNPNSKLAFCAFWKLKRREGDGRDGKFPTANARGDFYERIGLIVQDRRWNGGQVVCRETLGWHLTVDKPSTGPRLSVEIRGSK